MQTVTKTVSLMRFFPIFHISMCGPMETKKRRHVRYRLNAWENSGQLHRFAGQLKAHLHEHYHLQLKDLGVEL